MKNKYIDKIKLFFVFGTILAALAAVCFRSNPNEERLKEYEESNGEIVVIFDQEVDEKYLNTLTATADGSVNILRHIGDYALLSVDDYKKYDEILHKLKENPDVLEAQANIDVTSAGVSNDRYSDTQWTIHNPGYFYYYISSANKEQITTDNDVDMDIEEAWQLMNESEQDKREVIVAIIDTGVDYTHPDLAEHMWINEKEIQEDGIDNDNNGYVDDYYGWDFYNNDSSVCHYKYYEEYDSYFASPSDNDDHGTHVAGIIGAVANNTIGVAGIASNIDVKIMSLKISGGTKGTGSISRAIEAVKYATSMGADICNMSWGTNEYTGTLKQVMKESDMLFVAAAGNTGTNNDNSPVYPASLGLDNLISVTFIDTKGKLTYLSNYGKTSTDLAAPGVDIFSTIVGNYAYLSGSSMATPQVTGIAALLYAGSDNLYPSNIKEIILQNLKPLSNLEGKIKFAGMPSAYKALVASDSLVKDNEPPELAFKTIYKQNGIQVPINATDMGGSKIRVLRWSDGVKALEDFHRGITGSEVTDKQISIAKAGTYTFYASDYAGNETIQTYEVKEDISAPKIASTYTVSDHYKARTITAKISDELSGIKKVKYLAGKKSPVDFLPASAGTEVKLKDGKATFQVTKDGIYTIYAMDNRGNVTLKQVDVKTIKATEIKLARSKKTLKEGEHYTISAYIKPVNSTDRIIYSSSDKSVATVTSAGEVKTIKKGKVSIYAKTSSGKVAVCEITVVKR